MSDTDQFADQQQMQRSTVHFWKKVIRKGPDDCWEWSGYKAPSGYGRIKVGRGRAPAVAHRFSFVIHGGHIPRGHFVLHSCDNPGCVNPAHLRAGTAKDNTKDMLTRGREARGERAGSAKLTAIEVKAIRKLRNLGWSFTELGKHFGISWQHASRIASGAVWKK